MALRHHWLLLSLRLVSLIQADFEPCPNDQDWCPAHNTCCLSTFQTTRCIPNDLGSDGVCCDSDTACGHGYRCVTNNECEADETITDPLVQRLPRYQMCSVQERPKLQHWNINQTTPASLAYYSSHGCIESLLDDFDMVYIIIHGSGRNADDYFCAATVVAAAQTRFEQVLVLAPWFPIATDTVLDNVTLRWSPDANGGPWRYGADATAPVAYSSFAAMDGMIDHLLQHLRSLQQVSVVGHSAGGQFVQRWAMMTNIDDARLRSVVANPSSYAYLQPERWIQGQWQIPTDVDHCPAYNQWEWGVGKDDADPAPYVSRVIHGLGLDRVRQRLASRTVVYLAGSQDRCNVTGMDPTQWCYSHGLETTCMDEWQGSNRWQRHERYLAMLDRWGIGYYNAVVEQVGHDHSLMFNSPEGVAAIFGPLEEFQVMKRQTNLSAMME